MEPKDQEQSLAPMHDCFLIYDAKCRLSVSVKSALERRGVDQARTGIRFQNEAARLALGQRYRLDQPETAYFIQSSGKVLHGLTAFSPVLPNLRGGMLVLWGLRLLSYGS